jgi:arylsulfatase A-like enzyme
LPHSSIVVLVVDRLGAGFLGPYGATWLDTPAFNRLASQSLLIEHVLSDSPELEVVYRSYWTGRHAAMPAAESSTLLDAAGEQGYRTCLLTDDWRLAEHPLAGAFGEHMLVPRRDLGAAAKSVRQTQLAEMFTAASEWLGDARSPFLLWLHAEGMQGAWDAPWEMRKQWSDEDDPDPPTFLDPPVRQLTGEIDPDELLGVMHAYAAQVAVLNECLESFLGGFLESARARDTLLVFTSPRGYPLGEHRRIGLVDNALHGELLRTPLLLRFPDGRGAAHRLQAIVQPPDVNAVLTEWLGLPVGSGAWGRSLLPLADGDEWPRDRALAVHGPERALRTPAWFLRRGATANDGEQAAIELYAKPDDQWEVNEVSDRLPQVVEEMTATMENLEQAIQANDEASLTLLSGVLREGIA